MKLTDNPCDGCPMAGWCHKECYMKREYYEIHRKEIKAAEAAEKRKKEKVRL